MGDLIGKSVSGNLIYIPQSEFERILSSNLEFNDKIKVYSQACRVNILYMIANAGSGHIGSSFSSIEMMTYINLKKVYSDSESLFFSSKGHDAPALYSVLTALNKIDFQLIDKLRRIDGLPGHPDINTPHIITNTGSLGMGISKAKGFIISNRLDGIKKQVFVLLGDGELQEGQIWESIVSAVNYKMNELVIIVDHNKLQSDTLVKNVSDLGDLENKFKSFGLNVFRCNGNDVDEFSHCIEKIDKNNSLLPNIIIADTIKGKGVSFMEHTSIDSDVELYKFHSGAPSADNYFKGVDELITELNKLTKKSNFDSISYSTKSIKSKQDEIVNEKLIETYSLALLEIAQKDKNIVALDADLILDTGLIPFKEKFPQRFVECGIAEQDMVSTAGGLALAGKLPIVHSFSCFLSTRPNEQMYNNATEKTKIIYVGSLAGIIPAGPGHSHQAIRDIATVGSIPGIYMVEPCCSSELVSLLNWAHSTNTKSTFLRLSSIPFYNKIEMPEKYSCNLGEGFKVRGSGNITIISYGPIMMNICIEIHEKLKLEGINSNIYNLPFLNFVDSKWLLSIMKNQEYIYHIENHLSFGGQNQLLAKIISSNKINIEYESISLDDIPLSGTNSEVLDSIGYNSIKISEKIKNKL